MRTGRNRENTDGLAVVDPFVIRHGRTIDGKLCAHVTPSLRTQERAKRWMDARSRDYPGYWVKLTARLYAYREHTGDITFWRSV